ncbi:defect-in-organelle-trafficking protein DotC [Neisseria sp. HSC-16F19]|nr:type IV secretory system conjugative DNA transfer family protein [Neisseria sp. HSC-16F19]MCP2041875.1 defect-in-organelle-trafficking protein DotC [Neisseria sp. HSC-16F19]
MAMDTGAPPPNVDQIVSQYSRSAEQMGLGNVAEQARYTAIKDSGMSIGLQAGINHQLHQFNQEIKKRERDLDTVYDFGRLMIKGRVVPPVISEARDIYAQNDDYSLTIAGASYRIESQARFSSVPPNWREYLNLGNGNKDFTPQIMGLALKSNEKAVFEKAIREGFKDGIEQANQMISHNFDRLNRDYTGMLRFDTFVRQGKVTMPVVAQADIPVTHSGNTLTVDETLLRLTVLPSFKSDMDQWRTWITPSKLYRKVEDVPRLQTPQERRDGIRKSQSRLFSVNEGGMPAEAKDPK